MLQRQVRRFSRRSLEVFDRVDDNNQLSKPTPNKLKIINQMSRALVATPRGRGRPKLQVPDQVQATVNEQPQPVDKLVPKVLEKRKRGRPRKVVVEAIES